MLIPVNINDTGGAVLFDIAVGYGQLGHYKFYLWDPQGKNYVGAGHGLSADNPPGRRDAFTLPQMAQDLKNRLLSWDVRIGATGDGLEQFEVQIRFFQDVPGNNPIRIADPIILRGQFEGVKILTGAVRFV